MAGSVNKVIVVGRLGRDPETRSLNDGGKVVSLRVATSEKWRDKQSGEIRERTEWHSVTIWNPNIVKVAEQYLKKGSQVYIEGQLETRKWQDQSGADRYSTEIVLRPYRGELTLLDSRNGSEDRGQDERSQSTNSNTAPNTGSNSNYSGGFGADLDDEIPF